MSPLFPIVILLGMLTASVCKGQTVFASKEDSPRILFLSRFASEPFDTPMYQAIRAQLSAAPLILDRFLLDDSTPDRRSQAPSLAQTQGSTLVFWVDDGQECKITFFVPNAPKKKFVIRTIDTQAGTESGRYDEIAVIAASMIEGLLVQIDTAQSEPSPAPNITLRRHGLIPHRYMEILAAYTGDFIAVNMVGHAGTIGINILPNPRLAIGLTIAKKATIRFQNETLQLTLRTMQLTLQAAGRWRFDLVDLRVGAAYIADFRFYSTKAIDSGVSPKPNRFGTIHSLTPFFDVAVSPWDRIGFFSRLAVEIPVNETVYRIRRLSGRDREVLAPFAAKLQWALGVFVRI